SRKNKFDKSKGYIFFISKFSNKVIALSEAVKLDLINNYNIEEKKIVTIYNSCDRERLLSQKLSYSIEMNRDTFNYVTMGRLTKQKGQWHLIRAFKELLKKQPQSHLYILGEGVEGKRLEKLAIELGVNKNITFMG